MLVRMHKVSTCKRTRTSEMYYTCMPWHGLHCISLIFCQRFNLSYIIHSEMGVNIPVPVEASLMWPTLYHSKVFKFPRTTIGSSMVRTYICIYIYVYMYTYVRTYMYSTIACRLSWVYSCLVKPANAYIVHVCMCILWYTHLYLYTLGMAYIRIYMIVHVHVYTLYIMVSLRNLVLILLVAKDLCVWCNRGCGYKVNFS